VEGEKDQIKYGDGLHSFKLCVWGEKESSTSPRSFASPGVGWHPREWSTEIHLLPCGVRLPLAFYFFGLLVFKSENYMEVESV
jgi:hypothetical protein